MVRIFHCADIHLDSPFSHESPDVAAAARRQLRETFGRMVETAKERETDLFLICGDLFDREFVTGDTADFLRAQFASAPGIRFVIQPGNHDPYAEGSIYRRTDFGSNVYLFTKEEGEILSFPDLKTDVFGYAYETSHMDRPPFPAAPPAEGKYGIVMLHGSFRAPQGSACAFTDADLRQAGWDYYAMGHYHNTDGLHTDGGMWYGYAGCPQGRDFGECGRKGAVFVQAEKENGKLRFSWEQIPFCSHRYEIVTCDVSGCADRDDITEAVRNAFLASDCRADTAMRLVLEGGLPASVRVPIYTIQETYRPLLYGLEIVDRTSVLPQGDALENDPTLRGAFYRALRDSLQSEDEKTRERAVLALRAGLAVLDGNDPEFDEKG